MTRRTDHSGRVSISVTSDGLTRAVGVLRDEVATVALPLEVAGVAQARVDRNDVLAQLDDYILPRLNDLDAPLLAVVGGSTGAGKSTIVNSLAGEVVSRAGVLRPTTRASVLVHHPDETHWFAGARILPGLARITGADHHDDPAAVRLVTAQGLPHGLALLDAPDIDSVVEANRDLARQLLGAADLWIFVTTAARYADAVPWGFLRQAAERGTSIAIVLNRVPPEAVIAIGDHLSGMLATEGLRSAPVFTLTEARLDERGMLPEMELAPLREWLTKLGEDARARGVVVRRTLSGALDSLQGRTEALAEASSAQVQTVEQLRAIARSSYAEAGRDVLSGMSDGSLLRGEVLARWQEYVGTGELFKSFEAAIGRFRDRVSAAITGRPAPTTELGVALQSGVQQLVLAHAEGAALQVARRWAQVPGGEQIVSAHPQLEELPADLPERVDRLVRDWQDDILQLVRAEGKDRRTTARVLSFGVNGVGVVLMLVVFSQTMGLSGAEVGIAGGSAVVAQKLLEALFGDQAVRELATKARTDLIERTDALYADEEARILSALDDVDLDVGQPERLLRAAAAVKAQR